MNGMKSYSTVYQYYLESQGLKIKRDFESSNIKNLQFQPSQIHEIEEEPSMLSDSFNHESSIDKESLPYGTNRNDEQIQEKEEEKKGENYMSDEEENIDEDSDSENQT